MDGSRDKLSLWVLVVSHRLHKTQSAGAEFKSENRGQNLHHKTQTQRSDQLAKSKKVFTSLSNETRTFIETDTETYFETNILRPRLLFLDQNFRDRCWDFFQGQNFWDQDWDLFSRRIFLRLRPRLKILGKVSMPRSLEARCHTLTHITGCRIPWSVLALTLFFKKRTERNPFSQMGNHCVGSWFNPLPQLIL